MSDSSSDDYMVSGRNGGAVALGLGFGVTVAGTLISAL